MRRLFFTTIFAIFAMVISAQPMQWRGLMLDSGRQFQTVEFIERVLDSMAVRQMNVFHWHLTENDGWRIELKCAPKLTAIGSCVATGAEQTGFYTRADMERVVRYAAERGIMVVPEIDLPGHSGALIKAYPQFGCSAEVVNPAAKGITKFLKKVLDEVCEIFPAPYIHLGGDEVDRKVWQNNEACQRLMKRKRIGSEAELQVWFEMQFVRYLGERGRKVLLWEDVLYDTDAPLPENVVIHWWNYRTQGERGLREALKRGLPVVCSSNYYCYLNFPEEPWRGYGHERTFKAADIERNPSYLLFDAKNPLMLGIEACLWTDYNLTEDLLIQRLFPRLDILAEQMKTAHEK